MRVHYALLDEELVALFEACGIEYEDLDGVPCVLADDFQAYMTEIEDWLWTVEPEGEGTYWSKYDEIDYNYQFWSTEARKWL